MSRCSGPKFSHIAMAIALASCNGQITTTDRSNGAPDRDPVPPPESTPDTDATQLDSTELFKCASGAAPASAPRIWRLTADQYEASLRALHPRLSAGSVPNPLKGLASGERFTNVATGAGLPGTIADQVMRANQQAAADLATAFSASHPCLSKPDDSCLSTVFEELTNRAFRRPAQAEEIARLLKLFRETADLVGPTKGLTLALEAVLDAPQFLFRFELGDGPADAHGRTKLNAYEIAAAISYTLTDAPPDAMLIEAAQQGSLFAATERQAHVMRLLERAPTSKPLTRFFREYFQYDGVTDVAKNEKEFPFHKPEQLVDDTDQFVRALLEDGNDVLSNLLTADWGFVRADTAPSYNLSETSPTPKRVNFPAGQRAGILTQPSFLTAFSEADANAPVHRGKFIASSLICLSLPDTPPNTVPPLPDMPEATLRQRLSVHANSEPHCRACHDIMDPLGLGLEAYDHVGRFRTEDMGQPADATGAVVGTGTELDGPFNGALELGQKLAKSSVVRQCFVRHNFRYWFGRHETTADGCALSSADEALSRGGGDPVRMVAAFLGSDSFLFRK